GLVHTHEHYRPQALVLEGSSRSGYVRNWLARNGRSAAQSIVRACVPHGRKLKPDVRDAFLTDLWAWMVEAKVLEPVTLVRRRAGKDHPVRVPGTVYQLEADRIGIRVTQQRWMCPACRRAQSVAPPNGACPEYNCHGTLQREGRPEDHFDVVQYTRTRFVPLKTWEHTAQVPRKKREEIEREFKRTEGGAYNCLVCTPTLEMGVDIGQLEMVLMRNVPPTPANYAQRAGRAGRRHRIAVVFSYCRGTAHDRYFFEDPTAMIAGEIRVPAFSMRNEPLIRKHVHSTVLTSVRDGKGSGDSEVLDTVFPAFIWAYCFTREGEGRTARYRHRSRPLDVGPYSALMGRHRVAVDADLRAVFQEGWPQDDAAAVSDDALDDMVERAPKGLQRHVDTLFHQMATYRNELAKLRAIEDEGRELTGEEEAHRRRYRHAIQSLRTQERQENYTLSWLGVDGYFPGYGMTRQSLTARCLEPWLEISRPLAIALRELTPANFVYANKNVYRVTRIGLTARRGEDQDDLAAALRAELLYYDDPRRLRPREATGTEGGGEEAPIEVTSLQLSDPELRRRQDIDDREKGRHRVPFVALGMLLPEHAGGRTGKLGPFTCMLLNRQHLRLVNLGIPEKGAVPFSLFPLCTVCGATRSPSASEAELTRFAETHQKSCHQLPGKYALHVDLYSDVLRIGPFPAASDASNLFEGIRIGARHVLDMGQTELEGLALVDDDGQYWTGLYDPMPGGTGFLPQIVRYWRVVCRRAREVLESCPSACETSCYSCMRHFRNQFDHHVLDRHRAAALLAELGQPL
ncbi:MAG: DUF1998 domain-containing protein, partial [Deltaproteobacteria bacterium]|nr:DUF1998 domain-containing protein [Deltaproteobacteria bacterium]